MAKTNEFSQPINSIGGTYPNGFAGYVHKQPRTPEGLPNSRHIGDDFNGPGGGNTDLGFDVFAVGNGVVEKLIVWNKKAGYGNHLFIKHTLSPYLQKKYGCDIIYSHYAHLESFRTFEGQEVSKGQVIAKLGNSGTKYAHLHLEIRKPTGRGYEDYPTNQPVSWIDKYYFTPFTFIEENKKEPVTDTPPAASPQPEPTAITEPTTIPPGPPEPDESGDSITGDIPIITISSQPPSDPIRPDIASTGDTITSSTNISPPVQQADEKVHDILQTIKAFFSSIVKWFR